MEVQRAKRAIAHASAVADQAELNLAVRGNAAARIVGRMPGALVRQGVHGVHLLGRQRFGRRVLDDEDVVRVLLDERVRRERVEVLVLQREAARVFQLVGLHVLESRQRDRLERGLRRTRAVHRAGDERQVRHIEPGCQRVGDGDDRLFAHSVGNEVGARIEQDGALERIRPVIVMREPAQARLDAAEDDGHVLVRAPDQVPVDDAGVVGTQARLSAGGVRVGLAPLLRDRVVVHHRVHVPRRHEKAQPRPPEHVDAGRVAPIRLRDDADPVAVGLEDARDDGAAERGVVDVGIAAHIGEIDAIPPAIAHLRAVHGKKCHENPRL